MVIPAWVVGAYSAALLLAGVVMTDLSISLRRCSGARMKYFEALFGIGIWGLEHNCEPVCSKVWDALDLQELNDVMKVGEGAERESRNRS